MENTIQESKMNKIWTLQDLTPGTKVLLTNGQIAEFVEMKRVKFVGLIDGKRYRIGVDMFVKVVENVETKVEQNQEKNLDEEQRNILEKLKTEHETRQKVLSSLKKGDYFYINSGRRQNAELYIFEEIKNSKVIGINPITKARTRIDMSFNYYKL